MNQFSFYLPRKTDSILFPVNKDLTLVNLVHFVLKHGTFDTRLQLASDVCSRSCIQQNLRRSTSLLHRLQNKQTKLQTELHELVDVLPQPAEVHTGSNAEGCYRKMSADFLRTQLLETQSRIDQLTKLIEFLKEHKDGIISNQELVDLFSWRKNNSSALFNVWYHFIDVLWTHHIPACVLLC